MPPPHRQADRGNTVLAVSGVTLVVIFAAFYRYGGNQLESEWRSREDHIRERLSVTVKKTQACQESMSSPDMLHLQKDLGVGQLGEEKRGLERKQERIEQDIASKKEELLECKGRRETLEADDAEMKKLIEAERAIFVELNRRTKLLTDHQQNPRGMRAVLLLSNLKRLSRETAGLRKDLGLKEVAMGEEYMDELVKKWNDKAPNQMKVGDSIRPVSENDTQGAVAVSSPYDPDLHAKTIFFPKKTQDGQYVVPGWNGRQGTQSLRYGTYLGSTYLPTTDIDKQMRTLYNYATCAVGLNITRFMYPTMYKECEDCHTEYVHNYVETPVVLFCRDCLPQHTTNEFKLLCRGYTDKEMYGTALFWRARSRLRFKGKYAVMAEKWLEEARVEASDTIAFRIPRSSLYRSKSCNATASMSSLCASYFPLCNTTLIYQNHLFFQSTASAPRSATTVSSRALRRS